MSVVGAVGTFAVRTNYSSSFDYSLVLQPCAADTVARKYAA